MKYPFLIAATISLLIVSSVSVSAIDAGAGYQIIDFMKQIFNGEGSGNELQVKCLGNDLEDFSQTPCNKLYGENFNARNECTDSCGNYLEKAWYGSYLAYCEYVQQYFKDESVKNRFMELGPTDFETFYNTIAPEKIDAQPNSEGVTVYYITSPKATEDIVKLRDKYGISVPEAFYKEYTNIPGLITFDQYGLEAPTPAFIDRYETCWQSVNDIFSQMKAAVDAKAAAEIPEVHVESAYESAQDNFAESDAAGLSDAQPKSRWGLVFGIIFGVIVISAVTFFVIKNYKKKEDQTTNAPQIQPLQPAQNMGPQQ